MALNGSKSKNFGVWDNQLQNFIPQKLIKRFEQNF
jgi:hypothetical protein